MTRGMWALSMALALTACADRTDGQSYADAVAAWEGRSGEDLIDSWGDPTEVADAAKGSKLLVYKTQFYTNSTNSLSYCTTRFQVDKKGKIIATRIERQGSDLACTDGTRI